MYESQITELEEEVHCLQEREKEAEAILKSEIMRSVNSKLPVMNDFFHVLRHAFLVC